MKTDPMIAITGMEAAAWRASRLARQLLADHPDLPLQSFATAVDGSSYSGGNAKVELRCETYDDTRAWAKRLDIDLGTRSFQYRTSQSAAMEVLSGEVELHDVTVHLSANRLVGAEEWERLQVDTRPGAAAGGEAS
ncbi:hypothetical protein [Streptomyces sp. WMMC897]|uniref:hypothetical protein n=1 Tax=Streptomyces sp. WMMC897 TaxID=3014782 RepID=UPI0022B68C58|nr:hypothetical protein [Streptomyces sp. WMMC897]MCZ7414275.1 hypothetical protein [Streptomyces sp. WMMC897]